MSALAGFPVPYGFLVNNAGTLDASNSLAVTGNVTLRNSTLRVGNGGSSSASISGLLENSSGSIIDLSSNGPAAGDRLRVGGDYVGGGELRLDAALDASIASDVLIIDGIVVSGATAIRVTDVGDGTGAATGTGPGLGIRLVDVSATGGTAAGQFFLAGGPMTVNAFDYDLYLQNDGIWYLQSALRPIVPGVVSAPHVIEDMHTSGTAQTRHRLHTRLRHLTTGRLIDRVFAENERVPVAPLETRRATYSYAKADGQVFIDIETFDEFEFSNEQLGERRWFLKENEEYKALRLDGRLLDIVLPAQIPLKVVDTAPASRTGLSTSWKEAKLETGLQIMVPLFITNGDIIRVDTAGKKYLGKE